MLLWKIEHLIWENFKWNTRIHWEVSNETFIFPHMCAYFRKDILALNLIFPFGVVLYIHIHLSSSISIKYCQKSKCINHKYLDWYSLAIALLKNTTHELLQFEKEVFISFEFWSIYELHLMKKVILLITILRCAKHPIPNVRKLNYKHWI